MTDTAMKDLRQAMYARLMEAGDRRDIAQIQLIAEEAANHGQFDIAFLAQARKEFVASNYKETLELLEKILRLNPRFIAAEYLRAAVLIETGKYDEAIDSLNKTLVNPWSINPEIAFFNKACVHTRKNELEAARFCYWMAIEANSTYRNAYIGLITNAGTVGNWHEVLTISRMIDEAFAKDPVFLNEVVTQLLLLTESVTSEKPDVAKLLIEEARLKVDKALRQDPQNAGINYNFACVMARLGDRALALEHLKTAIEKDSERFVELAKTDPDLRTLRVDPEFQKLIGAS